MPQSTTPDDFRALTRRAGLDLNKDTDSTDAVGSSLDHLIGAWTQEDADKIDAALKHFETVDDMLWQ